MPLVPVALAGALLVVGVPIVSPVDLAAVAEGPVMAPPPPDVAPPDPVAEMLPKLLLPDMADPEDADDKVELVAAVMFPIPAEDTFLAWKRELNCASKLLAMLLTELATLLAATELLSALGPVIMNSPLEVKSVGLAPAAPPAIAME